MFSSPLYTPNPERDKNILITVTILVLDLRNAPDQCYNISFRSQECA